MRNLALGVLLAALLGCAAGRLDPEPAAGASLAGTWRLNRGASDDPDRLLVKMRAEALQRLHARAAADSPVDGGNGQRRGPPRNVDSQNAVYLDQALAHRPGDFLAHLPALQALSEQLTRSDFLTIGQSSEELRLDYGGSVRTFTPGRHSVISTQSGVADQNSGWRGRSYLIRVKPQVGPEMTEEYALAEGGNQLIMSLHLASSELPAFTLKRIYDRTSEVGPRLGPSND